MNNQEFPFGKPAGDSILHTHTFIRQHAKPSPGHRQPSRRRHPIPLIALMIVLTIAVITAGLIGQRLWLHQPATGKLKEGFAQPPLTTQQIDNLRHLVTHMHYKQLASLYVSRMSLDEEIGQLIMVEYQDAAYSPDLDTMIHDMHAGGVIMYQRQINTLNQTRVDTAHMQLRANLPLLIATDEEGWNVHRLTNIYPPRLSAQDIHDSQSTAVAASQGQKAAHDLLSLGINTNLAPDVDVSSDGNYIGYDQRSFGDTSEDVIKYAGAYIHALQSNGVIGTLKHFPGMGGVPRGIDPHAFFATVEHTKQQLYDIDLAPFNHFIHSTDKWEQPGMIMSTDELVPAIDAKYIAELSPTFITAILRQEMGYDGIVITDDLQMLGVQIDGQYLGVPQAAVFALKAGNDMILGPDSSESMQATIDAIKVALNNGTLTRTRLDEAAARIVTLKMERNLIPTVPPQIP